MDATDRSPGSRKPLQGPRPPRLAVSKDSHKIDKKPASTPHHPRRASVISCHPGGFMALVQRLTAGSVAASAKFAEIETAVRPQVMPPPASSSSDGDEDDDEPEPPARRWGILSPASLPPVACSAWWHPSALPFTSSCLPWLADPMPCFQFQPPCTAGTRVQEEELMGPWDPFALKLNQLSLPPNNTMPLRPLSTRNVFPDLKSGHGKEAPAAAGPVGGEAAPAPAGGDLQERVLDLDCCSIRLLVQHLVHVRTTISSSDRVPPCDASWFSDVKHLCSDAHESLEHLHYKMILAVLGVPRQPLSPSPKQLDIPSITGQFNSLENESRGLSGAHPGIDSEMLSLASMVMRCILLCRGVLGIMSIVGPKSTNLTPELPVFAFDDLTCASHDNKEVTRIKRHGMPSLTDPIYLSPIFIRNLLYLDLSICNSLTEIPPCIGNLHNLAALNLSHCYSLGTLPVSLGRLKNLQVLFLSSCHALRSLPVSLCELTKLRLLDLAGCLSLENLPDSLVNLGRLENLNLSDCKELKQFPQPFVKLQEVKYLNLSGSYGLDLDAEYLCTLANLKCVTLSPLTNIQGFPDSFQELASRLDMLRWWKKNCVHPQCNPEAAFLNSYRCYEQNIIDRLLSNEGDTSSEHTVCSICIVGESGMGKTELVRRIYSNQMILDTFNLRIWVYACDEKRLLNKIVESTTSACCGDAPISVLEEIVIEELTGKRLLLALDNSDSKSQYFWNYIRRLLNVCAKGSALIVTTKSNEVANLVGAIQTSYLSPVSKEECFMIFKGHVLGDLDMNSYPHLESIGWKVVEKSGGNPMCVKALSGLLCHSEISFCEIDLLVDGTSSALRLCYDLLPTHLQHCFKFCSLFPKDHIFIKNHIIRLWISQGFVFPGEGNQPEDTGLHYFDELVCRSFFQRSPFHNDQDDEFVMHELFHDLAASVSKDECFRCEEPFCSLPEDICHLSLVPSDFKAIAPAKEARNLQSFLVVRGSFPVVRILHSNDLYVKFGFLRALNLSYTDILELPSSIGNMKHLRLLALNNTKIKGLPFEIGQVGTLQTLELKDCFYLTDLPESTTNLAKLRHLDVHKEPGNIKVGMPHGIGQLTDLQTLTEFNIGNNTSQCSVAELKNLNGLRGNLQITGLENIKTADDASKANIVGKHFLDALILEWSYSTDGMNGGLGQDIANKILQNLQPRSNLQKLVIQNYPGNLFPLWMQYSYLTKVVSITLHNCYSCSELPFLGDLPFLKSLCIHRMNSIESFRTESNFLATEEKRPPRFPSLEALNLWEMYDLQFWVGTREGDFPRIRRLSISRCPKLTSLPALSSLVHLSVHCGSQLPTFSELSSLKSLDIEGFHKIRIISFPHQLKILKRLEIYDCKELSSIFAYSLSVSDLKVARCPKLDLVGSSQDDHHMQKVVIERNSPTRRSMVLKTATYRDPQNKSLKWEKHGEKNIFGSSHSRSYYRCLHRNRTGCCATKILQPSDTDPNMMSAMYIFEHNHEFPTEPHLKVLSVELETTRKRKESEVSSNEHMSRRQRSFLGTSRME